MEGPKNPEENWSPESVGKRERYKLRSVSENGCETFMAGLSDRAPDVDGGLSLASCHECDLVSGWEVEQGDEEACRLNLFNVGQNCEATWTSEFP